MIHCNVNSDCFECNFVIYFVFGYHIYGPVIADYLNVYPLQYNSL